MAESVQSSLATLASCRPELFQPLIGTVLLFADQRGQDVELELLEVRQRPRRGHSRDPFSLLFALKRGEIPPGDLLRPKGEGFAPEYWFVNRVSVLGGDPGVAYCEAVFG